MAVPSETAERQRQGAAEERWRDWSGWLRSTRRKWRLTKQRREGGAADTCDIIPPQPGSEQLVLECSRTRWPT